MNLLSMQTRRDCGPIAMANLRQVATGFPAAVTYEEIMREFPGKDDIRDDLWDSPTRHFSILERLTGQRIGLIPDPLLVPCVILLRLQWFPWPVFHWVTVLGCPGRGAPMEWHDGRSVRSCSFSERFPGCSVWLAYAIGGVIPLPRYWRAWGWLTRLVVG